MKTITKNALYLLIAVLVGVTVTYAGTLTPPGSPAKSMKSLSDLYQLVNTGANTPSTDFTTPSSVSATMNSLGDIYDLLKTNINAIDTTKILSGTTIFGKAGSASAGYTYPSKPLKTGQTVCYDNSGNPESCTGTGQDGEHQYGQAFSFLDNGDGTITDNSTGLMWEKCSYGQSSSDCSIGSATYVSIADAASTCTSETTAGHTDWRQPNFKEFISIASWGIDSPPYFFNPIYFPNVPSSGFYCSSTANKWWIDNVVSAYSLVCLDPGHNGISNGSNNTNIRCVRSLP